MIEYGSENKKNDKLTKDSNQFKEVLKNQIDDSMIFNTFFKNLVLEGVVEGVVYIQLPIDDTKLKKAKKLASDKIKKAIAIFYDKSMEYKLVNFNVYEVAYAKEQTIKIKSKKEHEDEKVIKVTKTTKRSLFNNDFTFENLHVGEYNFIIVDFLKKIAKGDNFNFYNLFLNIPTGFGKTHLVHAFGQESLKHNLSTVYINGDELSEKIPALYLENNQKKLKEIKDYYKTADFLIFDDFEFYAKGKKIKTNEFIYQILDERQNAKKWTITISHFSLEKLKSLFDQKIINRLVSGVQLTMERPDFEQQLSILDFMLQKRGLDPLMLDNQSKQFIVKNNINSITSLTGAVNNLTIFWKSITQAKSQITMVESIFKNITKDKTNLTPDLIIDDVKNYYKINKKDMLGTSRKKEFVQARTVAMYLVRKHLNLSFEETGKIFGRDHSTVVVALKKLEKEHKFLMSDIENLDSKIFSYK
ncbi:DnaA ATPase domain-containing protein [Mycoplasma sp. Ms02]|uniref:helix-turn-helix domain-containing protein n=1 Tax=Mycoplasma sp. Ms02 TaxID=353851 RepID=UPI001C8A9E80|nr:DnaA/Hda family protein [Mycoplasma sp. Ms02]QZE12106.1 ATP-binding protein [Mycoplasma sp. Ms02]